LCESLLSHLEKRGANAGEGKLIKCAANGGVSFIISRIVLLTPRRYILNYYFDNKFC